MEVALSPTYYDELLAAIATSLGGGALAGLVAPVSVQVGLFAGALVATVFVYAALFRNPPLPTSSTRAKVGAVVWLVFLGSLYLLTAL